MIEYKRLNYNPLKNTLKFADLSFENDRLKIKIKSINLDFDILNILLLKPIELKVSVDEPEVLIKNVFPTENKKTILISIRNLPLKLKYLNLNKGRIDLLSKNNKRMNLLSDITLFVPEIDLEKEITKIYPSISFYFLNKKVEILGKTLKNKDSLKNIFSTKIEPFDLFSISEYLPEVDGIKIISGKVFSDINVIINYIKNKTEIFLSGKIEVENLNLQEKINNNELLKNSNISVKITKYDILNSFLEIEDLLIDKGEFSIIISPDEKEKSIFLSKRFSFSSKSKKNLFSIILKNFKTSSLNIKLIDKYNQTEHIFYNSEIFVENIKVPLSDKINFSLLTHMDELNFISSKGSFNKNEKYVIFDEIETEQLDISKLKKFIPFFRPVISGVIKKYNGKIEISKSDIIINGKFLVNNLAFKSTNNLYISDLQFNLINFSKNKLEFYFDSLKVNKLNFKNNEDINNISFNLKSSNIPFVLKIEKENKITSIHFNEKTNITDFLLNNNELNIAIKKIETLTSVIFLFSEEKISIKFPFSIKLVDIAITYENKKFFSADSLVSYINNIKAPPFFVDIKKLEIQKPFLFIMLNSEKKFLPFSIFTNTKINLDKKEEILPFTLEYGEIKEGTILFQDESINPIFNYKISQVLMLIENYPTLIHTSGKINFTGITENKNNVMINLILNKNGEVNCKLFTKDLFLIKFSPYFEYYLGYNVINGVVDIDSSFTIKNSNVDNYNLLFFKNLRLKNVSETPFKNLDKFLEKLKDSNGNIKLEVPIRGRVDSLKIDFIKLFFDTLLETISSTGKSIIQIFPNFIADNTYEIVYFKQGTDEFLKEGKLIFSDNFVRELLKKEKFFLIEGYVDKKFDGEILKIKKLNTIIQEVNKENLQYEKLETLKKLYTQFFQSEPTSDKIEEIEKSLLSKITIYEKDFYELSFNRILKLKDYLIKEYGIDEKKIGYKEVPIFSNPYISGIKNNICIIRTGIIK